MGEKMTTSQKRTVWLAVGLFCLIGIISVQCIRSLGSDLSEVNGRASELAEELYSAENNMTVVNVEGKNLLIVNKNFLLNFMESLEDLDIGKIKADVGDTKNIEVYKEAGQFLTFILPKNFKGVVVIFYKDDEEQLEIKKKSEKVNI